MNLTDEKPPATDAHRRDAFQRLSLRYPGMTFEQAMADPVRSRIIDAYAASLNTREWLKTHHRTIVPIERFSPATTGTRPTIDHVRGPYVRRSTEPMASTPPSHPSNPSKDQPE